MPRSIPKKEEEETKVRTAIVWKAIPCKALMCKYHGYGDNCGVPEKCSISQGAWCEGFEPKDKSNPTGKVRI